jgi:hypothetical protein
MLERLLPRLSLADGTAVVIQHANNPFGFAWHRRVNEDNVDPNRNFREHFDRGQCSPDYEALYDCLNPADLDPANEAQRWQRIQAYVDREGLRRFQQIAVEGQYKFPEGLQFGGHAQSAGTRHLLDLVREHFANVRTLAWLDIHTGLGDSGACELITGAAPGSAAYACARELWGEALRSSASGESISTPLNGLLDLGLAASLPPDARAAFAFPEYGTWPPERVIRAMRADNWLHHHGALDSALGHAIKAEMLEAFRPSDPQWSRAIVAHGSALIERSVAALPGATLAGGQKSPHQAAVCVQRGAGEGRM